MSRLRELRLHGFKTFADPTRFMFEPGVNAVIGPNGSGKSNMADAVRWVLGEQSNRSLRTRRADDVIFAGSQQRKPQGMAEAVLTLDNADGWLPIDFEEVTVGRRAYRSGESEYLINGARVRLRDIVELLGEGRLGANELVVVGQGTVDSALSLRPEERRQLFEEAAGVKNLQVRKNEALARLARARDNLSRVTDLIGELKPQVRRLAIQAQHSQEHDTLRQRAQALIGEDHRRREAAERGALGDARRRAAAAEAALEERRLAEAAGREELRRAEERYWQEDAASRRANEGWERAREALIRLEGRLEALERRIAEAEAALAGAQTELRTMGEPASERAPSDPDLARLLAAAADAEERWRRSGVALADLDAALVTAEQALADERRRTGAQIAERARAGEVSARLDAKREQLTNERGDVSNEISAAAAQLEPARRAAEAAARTATSARDEHERALAEIVTAQPNADAARRRASELAEKVGAMRGELEALDERADGGGRLGSVLAAAGWRGLLDGLRAPEEAWPAIEAVVGGELDQALLWRDADLAGRLEDAAGSARLIAQRPRGEGLPSDASRQAALAAVSGERTLSQWLGGNGTPSLFAWTAVAPDVERLLAGWHGLPDGWLAVTPDGDLADGRGLLVIRGRAERGVSEAARRHARRRELAEQLERVEAEHEAAAAEAGRAMAAVSAAARGLDAARTRREDAEAREREAAEAAAAAELRASRLAARRAAIDEELAALPQAAAEAAETARPADLAPLEQRAADLRERREAAQRERDAARDAWLAAQQGAREAEERQVGAQRSSALKEARRLQLESTASERQDQLQALRREHATLEPELEAARMADKAATAEREAAEGRRDAARAELVELERGVGRDGPALADLERAMQAAAIEASRHEEALAALARERQVALDSLTDAGEVAPDDAMDPEVQAEIEALEPEALGGELRRVRRTLSQIGSVNPFAVEEHRELSGRLEALTTQDDDLSGAIGSTEELIAQLDADIADRFNAAFAAIAERFDEFCQLLFAGGSASLSLGDGSDGEAAGGIEIVVRPPGKRLQRLAMLSGGERALTGVALLFAMLSVNPVPFCILDEVDAALDEANIGRFAAALRRLAQDIDFVVITHNRATIEVADTIYGVTMSDAAVSAVVSLRLADIPMEQPLEAAPA